LLQLDANDEDDEDENVNNLKRIKLRLASSLPKSFVSAEFDFNFEC